MKVLEIPVNSYPCSTHNLIYSDRVLYLWQTTNLFSTHISITVVFNRIYLFFQWSILSVFQFCHWFVIELWSQTFLVSCSLSVNANLMPINSFLVSLFVLHFSHKNIQILVEKLSNSLLTSRKKWWLEAFSSLMILRNSWKNNSQLGTK